MKKTVSGFFPILMGLSILFQCSQPGKLEITHQVTCVETNCYLLYDTESKEAALFDVGGPIDSLVDIIERENLELKYLFCTHGHGDHIVGLPEIMGIFPDAELCLHQQDYEDLFIVREWAIGYFGQDTIDAWCQEIPEFKKVVEFDANSLGKPDIYLEDNMIFHLGEFAIKTIHSPGHSPGCICFHVDNMLFSGDVLFHRRVGGTHGLHSSREDMVPSVQNLYNTLPDETIVYPAHEELTDIGSEKIENEEIRADTVLSFN
jgi:glyoxylase-like metal-dependent hydrolase (beta-lactamase superfamily II)